MNRNRLYGIIAALSAASYGLLAFLFLRDGTSSGVELCHVKRLTDIPCPSCGTTRSILSLMEGNVLQSVMINPAGLIGMVLLILIPIWILTDVFRKSDSLYRFYRKSEKIIVDKKWLTALLIVCIAANWTWNIIKGM